MMLICGAIPKCILCLNGGMKHSPVVIKAFTTKMHGELRRSQSHTTAVGGVEVHSVALFLQTTNT